MDRDILDETDARADNLVRALEALAGLMESAVPGLGVDVEKLAPLVSVLAGEGRQLQAAGALRFGVRAAND